MNAPRDAIAYDPAVDGQKSYKLAIREKRLSGIREGRFEPNPEDAEEMAVHWERVPPQGIRWHDYADIFPWIEGPAFDELVEDVRKNGVLEPIVMLDGAVLDGRNRYMAARQLGIEYPVTEYTGDDPLGYVIAKNLKRRHLTESQRAMVASKLAKLPRGRPSENTAMAAIAPTQESASNLLNVSPDSIQRARRVERDGSPDLIAAVERGEIRVRPAADIAKLPKDEQPEAVKNHTRGTFGTGENEWYTPDEFLDAARDVLGTIDLDPASSEKAQAKVKAGEFFTKDTNGLAREWHGRVWLNPPYAQPHIAHFVSKMVSERREGRVLAAIMLTHNYTDTTWFHEATGLADAICFTRGRIRFYDDAGTLASPTQGQAFFYFGDDVEAFAARFARVGFIALPHSGEVSDGG